MGLFDSFKKRPSVDYIFAFLGNPGKQYDLTRHNVGFMALDHISKKEGFSVKKAKFSALTEDVIFNGSRVLFLRPETFMNNSGEAVKKAADFYKLDASRIIIIYDDINLDVGKIRIRKKGSAGGHNGMKSIINHLGTDSFARVRIGVGAKSEHYDLVDWVLSKFSKEDIASLSEAFVKTHEALKLMTQGKTEEAMGKFN